MAATVFTFVVQPVNALMGRRKTEPDVERTTPECPECLSSIPGRRPPLRVLHRRGGVRVVTSARC